MVPLSSSAGLTATKRRIATISPCAVGSFVVLPKLRPVDSTSSVADDDRAEGKVCPRRLGDGYPHKVLVGGKGRRQCRASKSLARRTEGSPGKAHTHHRCKNLTPVIAGTLG